jgi:hypothetical protein
VNNLTNISSLADPFLAPLPSGHNTGLIRQYIPRINSTVTTENITETSFPSGCDVLPGAFYVHYAHMGDYNDTDLAGSWSVVACMAANQSNGPWNAIRNRQDISEQLYLNITINGIVATASSALFELTLRSTLGYFELPNYFNEQSPGPLLDIDPWLNCSSEGTNCWSPQTPQTPLTTGEYRRDLNNGSTGMSNSSVLLGSVPNKGPLLSIAMALFGEGSYIANRYQHPEVYIWNETNTEIWDQINQGTNRNLFNSLCVEKEPDIGLLAGSVSYGTYPGCVQNLKNEDDALHREIETWLFSLAAGSSPEVVNNAFEAAAFLANEAWLVQSTPNPTLSVNFDLGADTEIPVISLAGIILISVLLLIYLVALCALAIYSVSTPVWTATLDAYDMMRIGAAVSVDCVPLMYERD